ncbi:TlpA disulfide reductase family protein [Thioalkalivibrio halophilus]|uniref:Thioredoxin domain-containing protein n=1 Tax=Thioalkalivibrio halophilus TaxID=252474 RepID=A0A1V2ZWJ1_9GAMM|nr:TlpA disulfide reductase family protein [Thioalkalivibrio halophilus]OOC09482.1 hypothetical protein B1A74_10880 [Thioalkalivibrio halophilus]
MRSIPWSRTGRALLWLVFLLLPSGLLADGAAKEFTIELDGGDLLEVETLGEAEGTGPLFIWLIPAAEELDAPRELLGELAEQGATVWVVDLLDSLLLERASSTVRGETHRLEDRAGQVTLVNFWASWCPPCVHEIPSMNRLEGSYDEDEFAIVSINFRESPEHILEFMEEVEVDFPVLMDEDGAVSQEWGVFAFPSSFLLDREGRVRYSVNEAIEWDTDEVREVIDELRDEPTPDATP